MAVDQERIIQDWNAYQAYRDDSRQWRESRDRNEKFMAGSQWTKGFSDKIRARGQSDLVLNRLRPLILTRVSMMIAQKPTGIVYGTRKEDVGLAQVLNDFIDYHWQESLGSVLMERTVMRQQKHGIGWMLNDVDNTVDYGRGELRFRDLSYRNVFTDKAAGAHPLFDDAPVIIVTKLLRPLDFFASLPRKIREQIPNDTSIYTYNDEIYWDGRAIHGQEIETSTPRIITNVYPEEKADFIRVMDVYRRQITQVRVLRQKATGKVYKILNEDDEISDLDKLFLQKKIQDAQLIQVGIPPQMVEVLRLEEVEAPVWRVHKYQQLSGRVLVPESEEILPISNYPVVPVVGEDTGNSMPLAEVDFMVGQQEMLNAAIGLTLLNASLASNWRVIVDAGVAGINDMKKFQWDFSIPGSWHNIKMHPVTGRFPGEIIRPEPLPMAWFSLVQYFAQAMEFQLSTYSMRTGDPRGAPETFAATQQLGQWATDILRIPLNRLELAIERLFNNFLEWLPHFYTFDKTFRIVGADQQPKMQMINASVPVYNEMQQAWETINPVEDIKANYRIRLGSTMPAQSVYELAILQQLSQQQPALIGEVLKRLPGLRESERVAIMQNIDAVSQLTQANTQQEEVIKTLQSQLVRLQEMVTALQQERVVSEADKVINKFVNEQKYQAKELRRVVREAKRNGRAKAK